MRKIFALNTFVALLSVIPGCIPIGHEIVSQSVIGERKSQDGQVSEQILKIEDLYTCYVLISPEGCGVKWQIGFYKFYLKKKENKIHMTHMPYKTGEYEVLLPVLPVQDSTKWIAARLSRVEYYDVDIELIVFDEKRIYKTLVVKKCVRTSTSDDSWTDLFNYGMTFENGNAKITFHTYNGEYLFDVIKNTFEKK